MGKIRERNKQECCSNRHIQHQVFNVKKGCTSYQKRVIKKNVSNQIKIDEDDLIFH